MLINLRNALMAGKRLPYDAEVEFLESTGTQYINTGIMGASEWHITAQGAATPTTSNCVIATTSVGGSFWGNYGAVNYWAVGNDSSWRCSLPYTSIGSFIVAFSASSVQFTVNGETITRLSAPDFSKAFYLYSTNGDGYGATVRIYGCKVYQNGVLVRDFIPVRKGTVGYLYDRVSGKLFGNAGTGDFVLGPDVVPVEYIESHGTEWIATSLEAGRTSSSIKIAATLKFTDLSTGEHDLAGSGNAATPTMGRNGSNYFMWAKGGTTWYPTVCDTNWHTVSYTFNNPSGRVFELDGTLYSGTQDNIFATGEGIHIFASGPNRYPLNCQLTKLEIWQNGILVRSFLTVRVGTDATSWEGALLDTVERKVYRNAGTGAFGYGNDLKYPIPAS